MSGGRSETRRQELPFERLRENLLFSIVSGPQGNVKFLPCVDLRSSGVRPIGLPDRVVKTCRIGSKARGVSQMRGSQFGQSRDQGF
jgi:hypothetical protein